MSDDLFGWIPPRPLRKPTRNIPASIECAIERVSGDSWEVVMKIRPTFWKVVIVSKYSDSMFFIDEFQNFILAWRHSRFSIAYDAHEAVTKAMAAVV